MTRRSLERGLELINKTVALREELDRAQDQLAAVRGAARAVLEYRDDDVAFRAAVNVLLVKVLGADVLRDVMVRCDKGETQCPATGVDGMCCSLIDGHGGAHMDYFKNELRVTP